MTSSDMAERADSSPAWMINYLPVILWQRRYYVLTCFLAMLALGVIAAFGLPRTYRSTATLLVQSQDLPTTIVDSPTNGAVEQRIARIREQVLSRGDLIQLIGLKARNGAALASSGMPPMLDTGSFSAQIAALQNENRQLIAQSRRPAGTDALGSAEAALAAAQAQYSDSHPDVIAAKERVK